MEDVRVRAGVNAGAEPGPAAGALVAFGVDEVFAGKASGKDFERPEWLRPTPVLRAGDVLVVKSIDRLGRGYEERLSGSGAPSPRRSAPTSWCWTCRFWKPGRTGAA